VHVSVDRVTVPVILLRAGARACVCGYHYVALNLTVFGVHATVASFHHAMNISAGVLS